MLVTTVFGSPRKKGNTATVLGWIEEELVKQGHKVDRITVADHDVRGCLGCRTCWKSMDAPGCIQKDDTLAIFDRMQAADALLYASPLFCWSWSGQIKTLIDRHYCLVKCYGTPEWKSFIGDKRAALLVTCAGPDRGNADVLTTQYKYLMRYAKCHLAGELIVPFCTTPEAIPEEFKEKAVKLAHDLTAG